MIEGTPPQRECFFCGRYDWADYTKLVMVNGIVRSVCDPCIYKCGIEADVIEQLFEEDDE